MKEIIKRPAAERECANHLAGIQGFAFARHNPAFDRLHCAVGHHLAVYTQILQAVQTFINCVGNRAYSHLQSGSILDQLSDELSYFALHIAQLTRFQLHQRFGVFYNRLHFADMHEAVA